MRIIIIEDEKLTAKDLEKTILKLDPGAQILEIIDSVEAGIDFFNRGESIDLIFSDIELGDGKSFEIFEALNITTPIIFCTAYNEYALEAFDVAGISYILKPFSTSTIQRALDKFHSIKPTAVSVPTTIDYGSLIKTLQEQIRPTKLPNIITHKGDKIIPLAGDKIALFYINNSIVKLITFDKQEISINYKLDDLEKKFVPTFFRTNRQYLINRAAVKEASHHFNRKVLVHLTFSHEEQILVGKEKVTEFIAWLEEM
jgi:two-component system, LytTR family, response regulator LytT